MQLALQAALKAAKAGEVPVGAVVVRGDEVLAVEANCVLACHDPSGHAEIRALRAAAQKIGSERLIDCDLYVTLEPCAMCAGAISLARIRRLYYGASDPKGGAVEHGALYFSQSTCHHAPEVYAGMGASEAAQLLKEFFKARRD